MYFRTGVQFFVRQRYNCYQKNVRPQILNKECYCLKERNLSGIWRPESYRADQQWKEKLACIVIKVQ